MNPTKLAKKARKRPAPDRLLSVGAIQGPHGLKGAVLVISHTHPVEHIGDYAEWWLGPSADAAKSFALGRCWQHGRRLLAELDGVSNRSAAEALQGMKIFVGQGAVAVADDEYLWDDLTGCTVVADDDRLLGTVTGLQSFGAQDILIVRTPDDASDPGEWMLPFVQQVVTDVDLDSRRIVVHLPEGMDACFTPRS